MEPETYAPAPSHAGPKRGKSGPKRLKTGAFRLKLWYESGRGGQDFDHKIKQRQ